MALDACMRFGNRPKNASLILNQSTAVCIHLLISLTSKACPDPLVPFKFFSKLHDGYGIQNGRDPVGKARRALLGVGELGEHKGKRAAIVVRAWNAWRGGPKNGITNWRAPGNSREPFPQIL